ncbi:MAG: DUF4097 family beta strand repeat protein [Eubacterium sp.]|nr:DUF4097 family beta strand repeat protein [Eubacterium sp.]
MKKWIITAVTLVIVGAVICFAAAAAMHFDFGKLDNGKYETNTYTVDESFRGISITASTEKVFFKPAEDGKYKVVCLEEENIKHEVAVINGTLTIDPVDNRKFIDHFGFYSRTPQITVYLPKSVYSDLRIETDTGDINIPAGFTFDSIAIKGDTSDVTCLAAAETGIGIDITTGDISLVSVTAGSIDLKTTTGRISAESVKCEGDVHIRVDTGRVKLQDMTCRNLTSEGTTGDITLNNVIAADMFTIIRDTGDVEFNASDAVTVFVQTDTGDVTGSLLTAKVFITETDTGKVEVPKSITGGRCEIRTDTGDIRIEVR